MLILKTIICGRHLGGIATLTSPLARRDYWRTRIWTKTERRMREGGSSLSLTGVTCPADRERDWGRANARKTQAVQLSLAQNIMGGWARGEISLERGAACLLGPLRHSYAQKMKFSSLPFLRQIQLRQLLVQRAVASLGLKLKKGECWWDGE